MFEPLSPFFRKYADLKLADVKLADIKLADVKLNDIKVAQLQHIDADDYWAIWYILVHF